VTGTVLIMISFDPASYNPELLYESRRLSTVRISAIGEKNNKIVKIKATNKYIV
jgi:hypothetical protein